MGETFWLAPLRTSKVAIVGFATESMADAPFDDPAYEIWILNMLHASVPRWDRLWELHDMATLEQETAELQRSTDHLGVLRAEKSRPIYMVKQEPTIPASVRFPLEHLTAHFGALCDKLQRQPYFTSTFAYMVATAVLGIVARRAQPHVPEPDESLVIAGVELLSTEEYAYQRSNGEFLIGFALGHGIPVYIPGRSALLESDGMYGYANGENLELISRMRAYYQARYKKAMELRDAAATRRQQAMADWNTHDGSMQAIDHMLTHMQYLARGGKV